MSAERFSAARRRLVAALAVGVLGGAASAAVAQGTMVRIATSLGPVDIELYDAGAPATVANFLGYVRSGAYDDMFFHRSVRNFVIQAGGWRWAGGGPVRVPAGPAVVNEFSATRSNLRGTVAMAKLPNLPNSATSEWFVNLSDSNAANLDAQNGGFTVFGRVTAPGMAVVDAIGRLQIVNAGPSFGELPIRSLPAGGLLGRDDLVMVSRATVLPPRSALTDADRIFNYLEAAYPQYVAPASAPSTTIQGYYVRYYAQTDAYVGVKDGEVYYLVPSISPNINRLESVAVLLGVAAAAGY